MQDIIIYVALLIVGLVVGLVIAKASFAADNPRQQQSAKAEQEKVMLAQLRNQLAAAQESIQAIDAQSAQLQSQITELDYIITSYETQDEQPKITFFGEYLNYSAYCITAVNA